MAGKRITEGGQTAPSICRPSASTWAWRRGSCTWGWAAGSRALHCCRSRPAAGPAEQAGQAGEADERRRWAALPLHDLAVPVSCSGLHRASRTRCPLAAHTPAAHPAHAAAVGVADGLGAGAEAEVAVVAGVAQVALQQNSSALHAGEHSMLGPPTSAVETGAQTFAQIPLLLQVPSHAPVLQCLGPPHLALPAVQALGAAGAHAGVSLAAVPGSRGIAVGQALPRVSAVWPGRWALAAGVAPLPCAPLALRLH